MRLTESRLRRIIRDVIAESMYDMYDRGPKPDSYEKIMADQENLRARIAQDEEDEVYRLEQEELSKKEMFIENETALYNTLSQQRLAQECEIYGLSSSCTVEQLVMKKYEEFRNMP